MYTRPSVRPLAIFILLTRAVDTHEEEEGEGEEEESTWVRVAMVKERLGEAGRWGRWKGRLEHTNGSRNL